MRTRRGWAPALIALMVVTAACSDDVDDDAAGAETAAGQPSTSPTPATTVASPEADAPTVTDPGVAEPIDTAPNDTTAATAAPGGAPGSTDWQEVVAGGDCACSDGSEFSFWVREADPEKVLFFFQGGGACWDLDTCDPNGLAPYKQVTDATDNPATHGGIWDVDHPDNPFADHSVVYVPYCTGDVHIGDAVTDYSDDVTIHHRGAANGNAALEHLVATFPDAADFVVAGESAGSIPSPMYAGLVSDHYPDADIVVVADGSGGYPDDPGLNVPIGEAWGVESAIPDWEVNEDLQAGEWSIPGLFVQTGLHAPDITFARHDFEADGVQAMFLGLTGSAPEDLPTQMRAIEEELEAATGLEQHSYTSPGDSHTVLSNDAVYAHEVDGVALVDWLAALIDGEPMDDIG